MTRTSRENNFISLHTFTTVTEPVVQFSFQNGTSLPCQNTHWPLLKPGGQQGPSLMGNNSSGQSKWHHCGCSCAWLVTIFPPQLKSLNHLTLYYLLLIPALSSYHVFNGVLMKFTKLKILAWMIDDFLIHLFILWMFSVVIASESVKFQLLLTRRSESPSEKDNHNLDKQKHMLYLCLENLHRPVGLSR